MSHGTCPWVAWGPRQIRSGLGWLPVSIPGLRRAARSYGLGGSCRSLRSVVGIGGLVGLRSWVPLARGKWWLWLLARVWDMELLVFVGCDLVQCGSDEWWEARLRFRAVCLHMLYCRRRCCSWIGSDLAPRFQFRGCLRLLRHGIPSWGAGNLLLYSSENENVAMVSSMAVHFVFYLISAFRHASLQANF